ncbi:hypothetical protein MTR67_018620 [Solanum verrucosum]|uniref:Uncharacterized protein n=1 Tax=Solanum verrucosum TaxID=315347 RepID=A0AAF0QMP0_SOLVR|nr:hypothetical protein MTR67_018620 [Solanum verrucosum]
MIDFKGGWDDHLPLIEFAYNTSNHSSIQTAPYEAFYERRCRYPVGWFEVGDSTLIGQDSVHDVMEKVQLIRDRLKSAQSPEGVMIFGKKGKLIPRYVVPYKILKRVGDPASIIPLENVAVKDSLTYEEVPVEILDRQVLRLRNKEVVSVKVLWRSQFVDRATWEAESSMKAKYPHLFPSDSIPA